MSTRRSSALAQKSPSNESENDDVEMRDGSSSSHSAADLEDEGEDESGSRGLLRTIGDASTYLCELEEDGEELAGGFQRIPNRRSLPDYFEVISAPVAFSTIRQKVLKKQYTAFTEFVRDVAQICHNAQVYNRPSAPIFGAAEKLRQLFKEKLQDMASKKEIQPSDAILPDLGDLPPVEDSPPPGSDAELDDDDEDEDEDEDEEEEEEEEEDDDDDSVDDRGRPKKSRRRGQRAATKRRERDADRDDDDQAKGGRRPPSVLTPMEARISAILKGLRKVKSSKGQLLVGPFEKVPDKASHPDYHATIPNPIAVDLIKKKAKRKKYQTVDQVMADIERMFENAKRFNEDGSEIHDAAAELQQQARVLAEREKLKPDEDFRDEDGKLPLSEIEHRGEIWRVGDWVHIRNANDLAKPIVAQIFRTWQNRDGQRWINACWYYRPEQTVHRYDKHFFDHEVVKTGQYRDHQVEDVLDRCFVMFVTRFNRGRPRGFPRNKEVYVCESRFNEEKARFVKIKTWASCVPDEVRDKDYEMDLFDGPPQRMRKLPSPIKHLLRDDAKATDDLPKPTWGSPNAPPIVGAVHRLPRDYHDSPPPEPEPRLTTPSTMADAVTDGNRRASMLPNAHNLPSEPIMRPVSTPLAPQGPLPSPGQYQAHAASHFQPQTSAMGGPPTHQMPTPAQQAPHITHHSSQPQNRSIHYQQQHFSQPSYAHSPVQPLQHQQMPSGFNQAAASTPRTAMASGTGVAAPHTNMYNPPRPPEVYTLTEAVNDAFTDDVRHHFQCDSAGRVLFFTSAPLGRAHEGLSSESAAVGHSARYLAGRSEWVAERARKRKLKHDLDSERVKKRSPSQYVHVEKDDLVSSHAHLAMENWFRNFGEDTALWTEAAGLQGWARGVNA